MSRERLRSTNGGPDALLVSDGVGLVSLEVAGVSTQITVRSLAAAATRLLSASHADQAEADRVRAALNDTEPPDTPNPIT